MVLQNLNGLDIDKKDFRDNFIMKELADSLKGYTAS